jgi:hypothetical protein
LKKFISILKALWLSVISYENAVTSRRMDSVDIKEEYQCSGMPDLTTAHFINIQQPYIIRSLAPVTL